MPPLQTDLVLVQCLRLQDEILEEGRYQPHSANDHAVRRRLLLPQPVQKRGEVGTVFTQVPVVMKIRGPLDRRCLARVVKVVHPKALELIPCEFQQPGMSRPAHHYAPYGASESGHKAIIFGYLQAHLEAPTTVKRNGDR